MMKFNPLTSRLDLVGATSGGSGTVTSVSEGAGIQATPNPIVGAGSIALDIASLTPESTLATGDLFAFVDVSVGTDPADQRSVAFSDILAALNPLLDHGILAGLTDDDHTQYVSRAGRTGTTNDFTLSTDTSGHIVGSAVAAGNLNIKSNSVTPDTSEIQLEAGVVALQAANNVPPVLRFDDGSGFTTSFVAQTQAADIAYALPASSASGLLRNTAGVLSWDTASFVDGSGAAGRVAFWADANTLTSDAELTYDGTTNVLAVSTIEGFGGTGSPLLLRSNSADDDTILLGGTASDVADVIINGGATEHDITFEGPTLIKSFVTVHDSKQTTGGYGSANAATVLLKKYGGTLATAAARVYFARSRGTQATPAAIADDDCLGRIDFLGFGGTLYRRAARVVVEVDDPSPDDTQIGGLIRFQTAGTPGALADRLVLNSAGYATFSGSVGIRNVLYTWPAADAAGVLTSNGSGTLSWAAATGTITVQESDVTIDSAVTTLDFIETDGTLVTSSPAGEANINMDLYFLRSGRPTGRNTYILSSDTSTALLSGGTSGGQNVDFESTTSSNKGTIQFRDPVRFFSNPASPLTSGTLNVATCDNAITGPSGAALTWRYFNLVQTFTLSDNLTSFQGVRHAPTIQSTASSTISLGTYTAYSGGGTFTPGASATMTDLVYRGLAAGPTLSNAGASNTATSAYLGVMGGAINTNWTATDWAAIKMLDPTGTGGTITRLGAMEIDALTARGGSTMFSVWSKGTTVNFCHSGPAIIGVAQSTLTAPNSGVMLDLGGAIALRRIADVTVVNGSNTAVATGNTSFVRFVGPTAAYTIHGIAGGVDGKMQILYNTVAFNMTLAHQSGTEGTAANRLITMSGANQATNAEGAAIVVYDGSVSRWIVITLQQ